ncbi:MAG: hypothetical protein WC538_02120 [Thermoanaerobaculia bacterium]|jgi:hypothetical protein
MSDGANRAFESDEARAKRRGFWSNVLMVAVLLIVVPWMNYAWERTTGVTVAGRFTTGKNSSAASLSSAFNKAFGATVVALPFVLLSLSKRRQFL